MKNRIKISIMLLVFLIFMESVYGLEIGEIMFNPLGSDTGREWIKIEFNSTDGCINLTEYKLYEENANHNIYPVEIHSYSGDECSQAIICTDVNKLFLDYPHLNSSQNNSTQIYRASFSLSNIGEELGIKKSEAFVDYINYSIILSQVSVTEGHSLILDNNTWKSAEMLIITYDESENETENNNSIYNATHNATEIILLNETVENETGTNTLNETEILNETGNTTNNTNITEVISMCTSSISIILKNESKFYNNNAQIKFYNKIYYENVSDDTYKSNYSIEYWIEDLSGNIIKNKVTTTNQGEKSFTPSIEESDKILLIKNTLKQSECIIINESSETILLIKNNNYLEQKCLKTDCPKCDSKTTSVDYANSVFTSCDQKPIIKTVNVCNASRDVSENTTNKNASQTIKSNSTNLGISQTNNPSENNTQIAGKTTGMIVYESPNLKNRLYALIGLILVGITCIAMIFYKVLRHKILTDKAD